MTLPILSLLFAGGYLVGRTLRYLHILQLEDYSPGRLILFIRKRPHFWFAVPPLFISLLIKAFYTLFPSSSIAPYGISVGLILWSITISLSVLNDIKKVSTQAHKKLVLTARARRLFLIGVLLGIGVLILIFLTVGEISNALLYYTATGLLGFIWLTLSLGILHPIETMINQRYIQEAEIKISKIRPLTIGITGSYGKTSTKELLSALLSLKWNVLKSPGSYNTLMGVTRWIRNHLQIYHEVMIVEMGAYRKGSIKRLCHLVKPHHGIITVIGVQHLERFGSQESILQAKSELVESLPSDGIAVLNASNPPSQLVGNTLKCRVVWFAIENATLSSLLSTPNRSTTIYRADKIKVGIQGTAFLLHYPDGEHQEISVPLLGRSVVSNLLAAVALADSLGIPRELFPATLSQLKPIPHRLSLSKLPTGVTLIDDTYNSNPIGARDALEVLRSTTSGKRVLITSGMIELGPQEKEANYQMGKEAANSCDLVALVGKRRVDTIYYGLRDADFPNRSILRFRTTPEALRTLLPQLHEGDVVLIENDLPDQYIGL